MKGRAPVNVHMDKDIPVSPELGGTFGWLDVGGVHLHLHSADDADRLAEAARELGAMLRLQTKRRVS